MHLDDGLEIDDRHAVEDAVAQNAGVVDDAIHAPNESICRLDDVKGRLRLATESKLATALPPSFADEFNHPSAGWASDPPLRRRRTRRGR